MVQEWIASWRRRQRRRSAESMLVWCEQANIVFEACALALKQDGPPAPPDVTLNRIDWDSSIFETSLMASAAR